MLPAGALPARNSHTARTSCCAARSASSRCFSASCTHACEQQRAHTAVTPASCVPHVCMQLPVAPYAAGRGLRWQGHKDAADAHTACQLPATTAAGGGGGCLLLAMAAAAHLCCQAFLQLLLLMQQIVQLGAHLTATPATPPAPAQHQQCGRACQRRRLSAKQSCRRHLLGARWRMPCRGVPWPGALCCAVLPVLLHGVLACKQLAAATAASGCPFLTCMPPASPP